MQELCLCSPSLYKTHSLHTFHIYPLIISKDGVSSKWSLLTLSAQNEGLSFVLKVQTGLSSAGEGRPGFLTFGTLTFCVGSFFVVGPSCTL